LRFSNIENWKRAHWLSRSAETYANHFFKEEWQAAVAHRGAKPSMKLFADSAIAAKSSGKSGMEIFNQALTEIAQKVRPRENLLDQAKIQILQHLKNGGLYHSYGFDQERTLDTEPVSIPSECWNGIINWSSDVVCFQSLKFREVRIRFERAGVNSPSDQAGDTIPNKLGRPSFKEPILQAFNALYADGLIDTEAPIKSHWPLVRQYLSNNQMDLPKPASEISSETFRRYLSHEIKYLRETKKQ